VVDAPIVIAHNTYMHKQAPLKAGDRIKLINMIDDPDPIKPGTLGTVRRVLPWLDEWTVYMEWDGGHTYELVEAAPIQSVSSQPAL
jgi:hypothetical protein